MLLAEFRSDIDLTLININLRNGRRNRKRAANVGNKSKHESVLPLKIQSKVKKAFKSKEEYEEQLESAQKKMFDLQQFVRAEKLKVIIVFEGSDAAGKGGVIKRMTELLDPRGFRVNAISKPNQIEKPQNYFERFFKLLPEPGAIAIFDRSWYGRVLVERVEGLIPKKDWARAYGEINAVEQMLCRDGVIVLKYFLDVSYSEQEKRFKDREKDPLKKWKLTDEDWRNRKKWDEYITAFLEMIKSTSTTAAPWNAIASDSKWFARVEILRDIEKQVRKGR